ncbi:MAG: glutathione S-transferase family protein [Alphaproteobacteria bacterium]|nr:glutathione S-transferase family protein [Alphaproteobacteria bacterium]
MGLLVDGVWHDKWYDTKSSKGAFIRSESQFRNWITADGSSGFPAEADRYRLYVSLACPWAHRTLIVRALKGLEDAIPVTVVSPYMGENGWPFADGHSDPEFGKDFLWQIYTEARPDYSGRVTVPVLFDRKTGTIVNNESAEIVRMLNSAFNAFATNPDLDLYPEPLRAEIDAVNARIYDTVNNGVYKTGFATTQEKYDQAVHPLFDSLDWLDERLANQRYLVGDRPTEADWRLFATLVRFDAVYFAHFKCNIRQIRDYPNLQGYLKELYQMPGVAETVDFRHIIQHYYWSQKSVNPSGIVPAGAAPDLTGPHGRDRLAKAA